MLRPPDLIAGSLHCWIFGECEGGGDPAGRPGYRPGAGPIPPAFTAGLTELGETACELLSGRFVVVIHDRERERCSVTRDQLGAQPLVYCTQGSGGILFAEHERDLLELLPRTPAPDRLVLLQWVENGLSLAGRTFFEGVDRLPAGHRLVLDATAAIAERWWDLRYAGTEAETNAVLAERLRERAFEAVARSAAGAERPAVKLSGGLDSACVAAGMTAISSAARHPLALAGTFPAHPATDESGLIEATARHTRLPLERIAFDPTRSMLSPAVEHIANWRLPPATPNLFLWKPLMARARELGIDLILDGEGGDELFGLASGLIADMLRTGRPARAWMLSGRVPGIGEHPSTRVRLRVLRSAGLSPLMPRSMRRSRALRRAAVPAIVPAADARALAELHDSQRSTQRNGPLWWRSQVVSLIDDRDLLGMASHFRREAADERLDRHHPFLYDLPLIETALRIPPQAQFDPVRDRPLLRDGLIGLIPDAVRTRHAKSYFTPVVLAGIQAAEAGLIEPLQRADAPIRAYVDTAALERKVMVPPGDRLMAGAASLWRVAIVNRWLESESGHGA